MCMKMDHKFTRMYYMKHFSCLKNYNHGDGIMPANCLTVGLKNINQRNISLIHNNY